MSDFFERLVADMTKGAAETEGFIRGGRVAVQAQRDPQGFEQKLAAATPPPIPAAAFAKKGPPPPPAAAMAKKGPPPVPKAKGATGAERMFTIGGKTPEWAKGGSVSGSYANGAEAALAAFGVKEAIWGTLATMGASLLGGSALKAGLGAAARRFAPAAANTLKGRIGGIAQKGLNTLNKGGMGADAMNMGASMVAGEAANRVFNPG